MSYEEDAIWETQYEELKRRVDHQIEANRRLEDRAEGFLRIILTTIGIFIAGISIVASTGYLFQLGSPISEENFGALTDKITTQIPMIGEPQASLVATLLLLSLVVLLSKFISETLISVPRRAYDVLAPSMFEPGVNSDHVEGQLGSSATHSEYRGQVLEEYLNAIEQNDELLEQTRSSWEDCYKSFEKGVQTLGAAILLVLPAFIFQSSMWAILGFGMEVLWVVGYLNKTISWDDIKQIAIIDPKTDLAIIVTALLLILSNYRVDLLDGIPLLDAWTGPIIFVCLSIIPIAPLFLDEESHNRIFNRTALITGVEFIAFALIEMGTSTSFSFDHPYISTTLSTVTIILIIGTILIGIPLLLRKSAMRVKEQIEDSKIIS